LPTSSADEAAVHVLEGEGVDCTMLPAAVKGPGGGVAVPCTAAEVGAEVVNGTMTVQLSLEVAPIMVENFPLEHKEHNEAPAPEYWPAEQLWQLLAAFVGENVPALHRVHDEAARFVA